MLDYLKTYIYTVIPTSTDIFISHFGDKVYAFEVNKYFSSKSDLYLALLSWTHDYRFFN